MANNSSILVEKYLNATDVIWTAVEAAAFNVSQRKTSISHWYDMGRVQIPLYAIIFLLAVVGNSLVIVTLVQNQRMRTITNLFLLNLAVSDLLLGVLCMPFTLIGALLRDFVFGEVMCKLLPFLQACSVAVGVWTLVAISVERYYAICHPLRSLRWQTIGHAYKLIIAIWLGSFICMGPIAFLSQLKPTNQGNHKCREDWPSIEYEQAYNLFLDFVLLVIPLLVLAVTYSLITCTLCRGMKTEKTLPDSNKNTSIEVYVNLDTNNTRRWSRFSHNSTHHLQQLQQWSSHQDTAHTARTMTGLRRSNAERSLQNKKRVVKMLFAVVLEFFICWTPLYVINTIVLFDATIIYTKLGYTAISFLQLLAYTSSCCNPITYCFMNYAFRKAFANSFRCLRWRRSTANAGGRNNRRLNLVNGSDFNLIDAKHSTKSSSRCNEQL